MAGLPKTNEPGGICVPPVTKALAPTTDCAPMTAPSKIVQFMPIRAFVADFAGVHHGAVADGDPVPDFAGVLIGQMDDGAILNIGVGAHPDIINISP